jgi:hypothetical protein
MLSNIEEFLNIIYAPDMDREQLVGDLMRLRRAQRRHPDDEDLASVRVDLERAVGPTVGRAASARLLGVSQTALDRWVARGAIPVVLTPAGRSEVPTGALLDLLDALAERPDRGRHPLAALLRSQRPSAPAASQPPARGADDHRTAELRALAYHQAVARRLDRASIAEALVRLRRWRAEQRIHPRYADAWEELLTGPRERLVRTLRSDDEESAALRQSSPFAGMLDERERRALMGLNGTSAA